MMKRVLSLILVLAMVFSCVPNAFAVVNLTEPVVTEQSELDPAVGAAQAPAEDAGEEASETPELTKFESSE